MHLKKVRLTSFRNFRAVDDITFPSGALLVAAAPNATGKTNFLEALVVLFRGRSFRASHENCVRWGDDTFSLEGQVKRHREVTTLAVRYHHPQKAVRIEEDGIPVSPITFLGRYPVVLFLPEDTFLFTRGPGLRRNFLNRALVVHPSYVSALVQYQRALKQRNAHLKQASSFSDTAVWTDLLLEHASNVSHHRRQFVAFLSIHLAEWYERLSGEAVPLAVSLQGSGTGTELRARLERAFNQEQRFGHTLSGPHRDDLTVTVGKHHVAYALSQGQLRTLSVALKLVAHRYVANVSGQEPLFLLDDVLSELDVTRQETLLANLPKAQTLLTCTSVPDSVRMLDNVQLLDIRKLTNPTPKRVQPPPAATPASEHVLPRPRVHDTGATAPAV